MSNLEKEVCDKEELMDERIQKLLSSVFSSHKERFEDSYSPNEISEWDSLNHLNLVMAINNEFGIELGFEDMLEIKTVGDIKTILRKHEIK